MLVRWDKWLIDLASDVPSIIFFQKFLQNSLQKSFQFIFLFFYNFTEIKIKSFECPKSISHYEKNNAWNIRRLVDELFVPSTQPASVLYWRLSDFKINKWINQSMQSYDFLDQKSIWFFKNTFLLKLLALGCIDILLLIIMKKKNISIYFWSQVKVYILYFECQIQTDSRSKNAVPWNRLNVHQKMLFDNEATWHNWSITTKKMHLC